MDITRAAIEKNRVTIVVLLVVFFGGLSGYFGMSRAEDPGFTFRVAQVLTFFPGASPERVEQLVTDKIEKKIQEIPELDFVKSESRTGVSIITVQIQDRYKQMRPIWDNLRRKVDSSRGELPSGVIGPNVNDEMGDTFSTIVTLVGEGFSYAELKSVADQVRDELLSLPDSAKVEIYGAQEERIFVEYKNERLADLGLSPVQLAQALGSRNIITPGGDVLSGDERIVLEPTGNFEAVEDLEEALISVPGSRSVIALRDFATVRRGYIDPPKSIVHSSGERSLALGVSLREGGDMLRMGEQVTQTLERLQKVYPIGIEFDIVMFQPRDVEQKINDFASNLMQAVLIVLVVMLFSLKLRTGLIVASLIPTAILMAFLIMSMFGIGLDQMSLAALIIALGLLVDNAIVMAESIMVQMAAGKDRLDACLDSARELRIPLLNSTLTTAAAFLPIYLAESTSGEYTAPLFKVVSITLLSSWILSLTMTPLLCYKFLKVGNSASSESFDTPFYRRYRAVVLALLRHRVVSAIGVALIFFLAIKGLGLVPNVFFPPKESGRMTLELQLPDGTAIEKTQSVVAQIEAHLENEYLVGEERPEGVIKWATYIGNGGPTYRLGYAPKKASPGYAFLLISATSQETVLDLVPRLNRYLLENYPDVRPTVDYEWNGPPVQNPIEIRLSGSDSGALFKLVDAVKARLAEESGVTQITDDWGQRSKKLLVTIDEPRARRAGVSNQDVAVSLQTALSGIETTSYREGDEVIPVVMRTVAADRQDLSKIETLNVFSQVTGRSVPLRQVADLAVEWEPAKILRRDRRRTVTVSANMMEGFYALPVFETLKPWLSEQARQWPIGYKWAFGGEMESSQKANASIGAKVPIALFIILMLLVGQFNSVRRMSIILITIVLGLIGVSVGLLALDQTFGFMTLLGIISLSGVIINNGIVLLDRIKIEIEEFGRTPQQAVIEAGQRRLRPIYLSNATSILGLVPLYLGGGAMWEPMAVALMFGLGFGTLLTLGVVPLLYSFFFGVKFRDYQYQV